MTQLVSRNLDSIARKFADTMVLYALSGGSKSGEEIKRHITMVLGARISSATLRRHLTSLEREGLVGTVRSSKGASGKGRTEYFITDDGMVRLKSSVEALGTLSMALQLGVAGVGVGVRARLLEAEPPVHLIQTLEREGFDVRFNLSMRGRSGTRHPVDVFATRETESGEQRVLISFAIAENEVSIGEILNVHIKAFDLQVQTPILIAIPRIGTDARSLAEFYKITVIEAFDPRDAATKIEATKELLRMGGG